ncbi:ABC transporter ATP-binding protein [Mangrovimonas sp. DI 80]|uniref:ABC transporter ATP-binding protein n=1 Tax=Mangrovimonas sp. DI 80 TaxID=1779330 RepID=UPI000975B409|nr:ABC transporter ATP-binding protein [Mangrovimonas sp. DI 80]OMP31795.1 hypothetical protein BKM32_01665 [Mangrovimonas sp. DI 80]
MKSQIKELLKHNFSSLAFYYRFLGFSIIWMLSMSLLVGLLDGLGLAMFVPLLQLVSGDNRKINPEMIGNLRFLIDGLNSFGLELNLIVVLSVIAFFFTLKGIAKWLEQFLRVVYNQKLIRNARLQLLRNLTNLNYSFFINHSSGRLQNAMTGEVWRLAQGFYSYSAMFQNLILLITYLALAFFANPTFAIMVMLGGGLTNFLFRMFYKKTKQLSLCLVSEQNSLQSLVIQFVANFKYLKATNRTKNYSKHLRDKIIEVELTNRKIGEIDSLSAGFREPLLIYILIVVICIQAYFLKGNIGSVIVSLLFLYRGLSSVVLLQSSYNRFLSFHGSIENYDKLNNELKKGVQQFSDNEIQDIRNSVVFENVSFAYNDKVILSNVNFRVNKGELIGVIGESGSGKTTLINLIAGLIRPGGGDIKIDGASLVDINVPSYQNRIGYITQEPIIFEDSIFNNVTFWDTPSKANLDRFCNAVRKAHIFDFIDSLPLKEHEVIGLNGANLSGGQKQRLSIARELYKNIDFLLLDEATSALDQETQKQITKTIMELKKDLAIVYITHNLDHLKGFSKVFEVANGNLIEKSNTNSSSHSYF